MFTHFIAILSTLLIAIGTLFASSVLAIYVPSIHNTARCESNLITTLEAFDGFDIFLKTLDAANLTSALESAGPFTIFAPTDAAFDQLPEGALEQLLENPTGQLTQILLFHIVAGQVKTDQMIDGMEILTQQGHSLHIETGLGCTIKVNGATITATDIVTGNGIIHAIDTVVLPPPD